MTLQYGLCFAVFLLSAVRAKQNDNQLDGSRGLKRGVHVQGNRVSYGNFAVDKFHRLQVSVGSSSVVTINRSTYNIQQRTFHFKDLIPIFLGL